MKTIAGNETDGSYIKVKSNFTSAWIVETETKKEIFKKGIDANRFIKKLKKEKP